MSTFRFLSRFCVQHSGVLKAHNCCCGCCRARVSAGLSIYINNYPYMISVGYTKKHIVIVKYQSCLYGNSNRSHHQHHPSSIHCLIIGCYPTNWMRDNGGPENRELSVENVVQSSNQMTSNQQKCEQHTNTHKKQHYNNSKKVKRKSRKVNSRSFACPEKPTTKHIQCTYPYTSWLSVHAIDDTVEKETRKTKTSRAINVS